MKIKPNKLYIDENGNIWKMRPSSEYYKKSNRYEAELEVYVKDPIAKTIGWMRDFTINGRVVEEKPGKRDLIKEVSIETHPEYFI